jgi:hypothetical protein
MDDDAGTTILETERMPGALRVEALVDAVDPLIDAIDPIDPTTFPDDLVATRFSAEDWKQRALYENDRRQHIEQELLRIRDDLDRLIRRAAVVRRDAPS